MAPVVVYLFEWRTGAAMLRRNARRWRDRSGLGLPWQTQLRYGAGIQTFYKLYRG